MMDRRDDQQTQPSAFLGGGVCVVALAVLISLPTGIAANEDTAFSDSALIEFAELCDSTANTDLGAFVTTAQTIGFRQVPSIRPDLDRFFNTREAAFSERGETNPIMLNSTEAMLKPIAGNTPTSFFARSDSWVMILRSPSPLSMMNGVAVGEGHICQFFGYGWIDEPDAEQALANFGGDDFMGRGNTLPGSDWGYLFSGTQRGAYPKNIFGVTAVHGTPDGVPPTLNIEYVVAYDMTIPPEVFETQ